eukprot:349608-Chlamydomonas_euryale.AAC.8
MSSSLHNIVNIDLVNLKIHPRNLQLQPGTSLRFRNAAAGRGSKSSCAICLQVEWCGEDLESSQLEDWRSGLWGPTLSGEVVWELPSLPADASCPSAEWTADRPGVYWFHSEVFPFIQGVVRVVDSEVRHVCAWAWGKPDVIHAWHLRCLWRQRATGQSDRPVCVLNRHAEIVHTSC